MKRLFYIIPVILVIVFLFIEVKHTSITPLEYSDVFEVDEIALYSDGEYMVITEFKEEHTLYKHTNLELDDYYLVPDSISNPLLYMKEDNAVRLTCYNNYQEITDSKWSKFVSYEDYISVLNSSNKTK